MKGARVLIVEDEPALVRGLSDMFRSHGFNVSIARDGEAGLDAALSERPDLIVLDIMLPQMNGYEVCRTIRDQGLDMPILMLTAKGQEEDIILGLNLGADDYMTKPFKVGELIARANAFLRRRVPRQTAYRFGDCEVDVQARILRRAGDAVALTAKEFTLLAFFLEKPGRALSRDTILNAVWGNSVFVTPRSAPRSSRTRAGPRTSTRLEISVIGSSPERQPRRPIARHRRDGRVRLCASAHLRTPGSRGSSQPGNTRAAANSVHRCFMCMVIHTGWHQKEAPRCASSSALF
jgi:DNA-binding response OmpR family regulator